MREIALDTETTGLDPASGHRIVEIGAVEMIGHIRTGNHFHSYLSPQRPMPEEAEKIHGLSDAFLHDKPLFRSIADAFLEFIGDAPLVIHNAAFDMKFINAELERIGYPIIAMSRTTDTVHMARRMFPGQPANLDALCRRFNIDLSARSKHGALLDAELLAEVYLELRGGRQKGLALVSERSAAQQQSGQPRQGMAANAQEVRQFSLSSEEDRAHRQLLDKIKQPIWAQYLPQ